MEKFKEELKKFFKSAKYAIFGFAAFGLSIIAVDASGGADSLVAKILAYFWVAILVAGILFFTGLGNPIKKAFFKLVGLVKKKDEISNKKE
ncbi:MAG: hypothetical protein HC836_15755 [Richelia sp. RM2_1_2]|nr:hypothetical protein [Richelia sp. RM2_1_2]